jgi:hypothetical protein
MFLFIYTMIGLKMRSRAAANEKIDSAIFIRPDS